MNNKNLNLGFIILIIAFSVLSLLIGRAHINIFDNSETANIILKDIRLPRTLVALLCGGALALCGAVLQGYLRNPLADSGVLGISAISSLGAVIAIYFGLSAIGYWVIPLLAIIFALLALLILIFIAKKGGGTLSFILTGIILSTLGGGLLSLALSFAPNPYAASEIIDWQIGSFSKTSFNDLFFTAPLIIIGSIILLLLGNELEALNLGEETAKTMGINIKSLQIKILIGVGLIVGAAVSVSGVLSFIGLIIPHILRPFYNNSPSKILLPSFLFGAAFTLLCDIFVRVLWLENELKLGIIMTIIGAPFFAYILWKNVKNV